MDKCEHKERWINSINYKAKLYKWRLGSCFYLYFFQNQRCILGKSHSEPTTGFHACLNTMDKKEIENKGIIIWTNSLFFIFSQLLTRFNHTLFAIFFCHSCPFLVIFHYGNLHFYM